MAQIADTLDIGAVTKLTRQTGNPELAAAYLSQEGRRHTAAELDALADSLVMIATTYERAGSAESDRAARAAVNALVLAANGPYLANRSRKLEKLGHPQVLAPYPRAFDALVRIFDEAADSGLRHGTLYGITQLPDSARVVAFLGSVARSATSYAVTAVRHLSMDLGAAGITELRGLFLADAVVEPTAKQNLIAFANVRGWRR